MKRINKFIILSLKMEGFKRFKEPYTMEFDRLTYISGANGQGKSTIADAIAYRNSHCSDLHRDGIFHIQVR